MVSVHRALRALGRRVLSAVADKRAAAEECYVPDFSDAVFAASWAQSVTACVHPICSTGQQQEVRLTQYFRERAQPSALIHPSAAGEVAKRLAVSAPHWKAATVEFARHFDAYGCRVYGSVVARLDTAQAWAGIAPGPGDDAMYPIRPHRFAFLPQLSFAALYGEYPLERINTVLEGWMEYARAEGSSTAYVSTLVAAQRFIAMSLAWGQVCGASPGAARTRCEYLLLKAMCADARFLLLRAGRSVANNHLLADGFIGWYVCALLPELRAAQDRMAGFEQLFLDEVQRQILPDGTSFEHSLHYHEMCCELACAYIVWCRNNAIAVPDWLSQRSMRMLRFQMLLAGDRDRPWTIGDTTEDPMLPLDPGCGWGAGALRELYRGLFEGSAARSRSDDTATIKAYWLLGALADEEGDRPLRSNSVGVFPDGGFAVFGSRPDDNQILFRTGPAENRAACTGHMHADLLSIYAAVAGEPIVVDAGTYSYRYGACGGAVEQVNWRQYLMGPSAHNGVCIEGVDPLGELTGDFRPLQVPIEVRITRQLTSRALAIFEATIVADNAYDGLSRGVVDICGEYVLVYDRAAGRDTATRSFGFQFAPGVAVAERGGGYVAQGRRGRLSLYPSGGLALRELACGRIDPPAGWVSESYGELVPAPQMRFDARQCDGVTAFLLGLGDAWPDGPVRFEATASGDLLRFRVVTPDWTDHVLVSTWKKKAVIADAGLAFQGDALWLRVIRDGTISLRWVNGVSVQHADVRVESPAVEPLAQLEIPRLSAAEQGAIAGDAGVVIHRGPAGGFVSGPAEVSRPPAGVH